MKDNANNKKIILVILIFVIILVAVLLAGVLWGVKDNAVASDTETKPVIEQVDTVTADDEKEVTDKKPQEGSEESGNEEKDGEIQSVPAKEVTDNLQAYGPKQNNEKKESAQKQTVKPADERAEITPAISINSPTVGASADDSNDNSNQDSGGSTVTSPTKADESNLENITTTEDGTLEFPFVPIR